MPSAAGIPETRLSRTVRRESFGREVGCAESRLARAFSIRREIECTADGYDVMISRDV